MKILLISIVLIHFIDFILLRSFTSKEKLLLVFNMPCKKAYITGGLKIIEYILIVIALIKLIIFIF